MSIKIYGGHRIDFDKSGDVFLTDDSDERVEVDRDRDITIGGRGFGIPIKDGRYGETTANAEEALFVASLTHQLIVCGSRTFRVAQAFRRNT